MPKKGGLLSALDSHKGRDYEKERQRKMQKAAEKRKRSTAADTEDGDEEVKTQTEPTLSEAKPAEDKEQQDEIDNEEDQEEEGEGEGEEEDEDEDEEEDDEDIPLSELSEEDAADVVPHQRLTINNSTAILSALKRISFLTPQTPFSEHQSLTSTEPVDVPDPNDDLTRELAFYTVCASAAKSARDLLKKEGIPFSRPTDYFAEMVKSDEHMGKVKKKLYDEAAAKKASAEARKQRDLKKFGKQVQVAKLQQRQKEKRETLDKINSLKRKRRTGEGGPTEESDLFDVALEDAGKSDGANKQRRRDGPGGQNKRQKKDQKFGFGGKKRFSKSGDAVSSGDMRGFSVSKMKGGSKKGGAPRPGKSKRVARRG
ncbi:rRNA-processing protein and EBNA1-binding protein ebp2 [Onygenales sp. PD_10]|nr:rRNA-processing protein and EBNA1-binding protein ebp2 [Onygenales sp. PD_10]